MIIYGTKSSILKNGQITNVICPNCETNSIIKYSIFGKYAHVYWIPFFLIERITLTECDSCNKIFELKNLPKTIIEKIEKQKERQPIKFPFWMFSGLYLVGAIIIFGYVRKYLFRL